MTLGGLSLPAAEPALPLWPGEAPGEKGDLPAEETVVGKDGIARTSHVSQPTIQVYQPEAAKRTGTAVLVCPGGGYNILAIEHEGTKVCEWLNELGVTAVLLKYRVPRRADRPKHEAPVQDAQRALGLMRARAEEWGIQANRIGVLGFSAGGHLATTLLGNPERTYEIGEKEAENVRPDFGILIYPAYLLDEKNKDQLAPELSFNKESQPVFMAVSSDDSWASSSARLFLELQRLKTPVELHSYAKGGHGWGITKAVGTPAGEWPAQCAQWLREMKFIPAESH